jgi:uncharacterized surface protein with fasciclin (FAS1) repeats
MKSIIETAQENPDFSTLVTALTTAELIDTLSGAGPFTVFAPSNKAFEKIPEKTLEEILDDIPRLKRILTYHVIPSKVWSKDIATMKDIATVQGDKVTIDTLNGIRINDAKITKTDVECTNGIIHIIDTVLMP